MNVGKDIIYKIQHAFNVLHIVENAPQKQNA